jgi:acetoin utilization deacetylase AcuC-like enzyme
MAVALCALQSGGEIESAFILDFDLHFGDGTVNILRDKPWVHILNPSTRERQVYRWEVSEALEKCQADIIGVSAGFDYHAEDWGGLLETEDYQEMGRLVSAAARRNAGGCFGLLEGGYNHAVLGKNVAAFLRGLEERD